MQLDFSFKEEALPKTPVYEGEMHVEYKVKGVKKVLKTKRTVELRKDADIRDAVMHVKVVLNQMELALRGAIAEKKGTDTKVTFIEIKQV